MNHVILSNGFCCVLGGLVQRVVFFSNLADAASGMELSSKTVGAQGCIPGVYRVAAVGGAFLAADEVFIAYVLESVHVRLFIAQLATLLAI